MLEERLHELKDVITSRKDEILDEWIVWIRKDPSYAFLEKDELIPTVGEALEGYVELICDNKPGRLDGFVDLITEKRIALGFPLHAVMHAFEGFRRVMTPILLDHDNSDLAGALPKIFDASYYASNIIAKRYHVLASRKQAEYMRELEESVRHMKIEIDRAERASKLKDNFMANVSHELRTPLTVILGFSKLICDHAVPPEKMSELAEIIHSSGSTLLRMVNEIIMMAKLETGEEKIQNHHIYLNDLLRESAGKAQTEIINESRKWEFTLCMPEPVLIGDFEKLQTLFFNLFANAIKFSPSGSKISICSRIDMFDVFIDVVDEGIGVSAEERDSVFEKFRQVEGDMGRKYAGTGLGLSLARMVALYHGGDISVAPNSGRKGSVFTARLPLSREWIEKVSPHNE